MHRFAVSLALSLTTFALTFSLAAMAENGIDDTSGVLFLPMPSTPEVGTEVVISMPGTGPAPAPAPGDLPAPFPATSPNPAPTTLDICTTATGSEPADFLSPGVMDPCKVVGAGLRVQTVAEKALLALQQFQSLPSLYFPIVSGANQGMSCSWNVPCGHITYVRSASGPVQSPLGSGSGAHFERLTAYFKNKPRAELYVRRTQEGSGQNTPSQSAPFFTLASGFLLDLLNAYGAHEVVYKTEIVATRKRRISGINGHFLGSSNRRKFSYR